MQPIPARVTSLGSNQHTMNKALSTTTAAGIAVAFALFAVPSLLRSQQADAPAEQQSPWVASTDTRPAEQAYKNIKVFAGTPANRIERIMKTWKNVLGVECTFCHIKGEWEKDDVEPKEAARYMKKMTDELAASHFNGESKVTCYTCHRGDKSPARLPPAPPRQRRPAGI